MNTGQLGGTLRPLLLALALQPGFAQAVEAPAPAPAPPVAQAPESKPTQNQPQLDTTGLQSQALLSAIDKILKRAAEERGAVKTLPERDRFLFPPLWTETREDRETSVRELLDSALDIVTDAPVLKLQDEIAKQREKIAAAKDRIASLREKRLEASESGLLPGIFSDTQSSIDKTIAGLQDDIKVREADIVRMKQEIGKALTAAGVDLSKDKLDLLLDSVLGSHLLKLMTAFEVSKIADQKLATLLNQSGDDLKAARRYFAMHAALFAMLVEAQGLLIDQIDTVYLVRLQKIMSDMAKTGSDTHRLLQSPAREDQRRVLEANLKAQETSQKVSEFYKEYLRNERQLLADSRKRTVLDLRVADNTFETVEESFQLKLLMEDAKPSFDALHGLEAPGFEQIFRNENLKREFENLTRKLGPSS
ncbi:MAG: hypothetical protein WCD20_03260 [Rhodomicrobium sp.]